MIASFQEVDCDRGALSLRVGQKLRNQQLVSVPVSSSTNVLWANEQVLCGYLLDTKTLATRTREEI